MTEDEQPRQRYRIAFARDAIGAALAQRDTIEAWEAAVTAAGLPVQHHGAGLRPRLVLGAPLPVGVLGRRELFDVFLVERRPVSELLERLRAAAPAGHTIVDAWDVWLGEPALPGRLAAAEYRIELDRPPGWETLADAVGALLEARSLPRSRARGGATAGYDLRPFIDSIALEPERSDSLCVTMTIDPNRGAGRPEEVLAALGDAIGEPLRPLRVVRERLVLAGD